MFKKRGFMDKMFFLSFVFTSVVVIFSWLLTAFSGILQITDISPLCQIVDGAFSFMTLFAGFMVWKSKTENCRKFKDVNRLEELESEDLL